MGPANHSTAGLLAQIQPRLNRRPPVASGTYCAGLPLTFAAAASSWEISRTSRACPKGLRASRRQEASKYGQALPEQARASGLASARSAFAPGTEPRASTSAERLKATKNEPANMADAKTAY